MKHYRRLSALLWAIFLFAICSASFADVPMTMREAKGTLSNGSDVSFDGVSVTATFAGGIYVENSDRSQGIRVDTGKSFAESDVVNVSGTIETDPLTDERYVAASTQYPQATGNILVLKPLGLVGQAFTGGDSGFQQGIADDQHLNNIGLLVTVWGPVSAIEDSLTPTWFKVGNTGEPEIKVVVPSGTRIDKNWQYVMVTGISSVEKVNGSMIRVLKARGLSDVACRVSRADTRIKTMTLDEKVGQLFTIQFSGDTFTTAIAQTIQTYHLGGVIYLQVNGNLNDPMRSAQFSNDLQACAIANYGIPLLISMDQEGGRVTRITGGADFPGNMALGASRNTNLALSAGSVFGSELKAIGGNMDLAPVLDVNNNPLNPVIGVRSFGEQPGLVSQMGISYIQGLHSTGVIAMGKHFPGHGDTATDSHTGLPIVTYDLNTLNTIHAEPFRQAINNGVDCIMTAHILLTCLDPNRPATLSPLVVDGYLRDELGFDGVCMTDSLGMGALRNGYTDTQIAVMAIQAGVDILLSPADLGVAYNAVKSAVQSGAISQARLDQAVTRILSLKYRYGVMDDPYVDPNQADSIVGSPEHKTAELSAARAGITLVQNTNSLLPLHLTSGQKILLVTVQSSTETVADAAAKFSAAILQKHSNVQSLALAVNPTSSQRTTVKTAAASAYVTIIGTSRSQLSSNVGQATLVKELRALGRTVIVVGLREPYELASFPETNAYVAAYNYRDCGFQAAADVIFGTVNPSGLLPVTIPGLYSYGRGLSY